MLIVKLNEPPTITAYHLHYAPKSDTYVPSVMIDATQLSPTLNSLDYFFSRFSEAPPINRGTPGSCSFSSELHARLPLGVETPFPRSPREAVRETRPRGATWAETRLANPELVGGNKSGATCEIVQLERVEENTTRGHDSMTLTTSLLLVSEQEKVFKRDKTNKLTSQDSINYY